MITSNVPTDVVDGAQVSFPSASPHTLTITLGALTSTHMVDVTPAVVEYTVSYDLAGGVEGTPVNPASYTIESAPITLTAPVRDGFTFTGWTGTGLTEPTMSVTIPTGSTGDRAFTATWEANPAASLVISGPTTVTELESHSFTVEAFDAHGVSLGDVTGEVTFTGADITGTDVSFPVDFSSAGQITTRTLTAVLDSDPSVTGTLDVHVASAVTGITVTAPAIAAEGDTITVEVTATGASGALGNATGYAVITSNVPTDVVDGAQVSFPSASPHTLTITLGALTSTHTVDVTPAVVVNPTPTPAPTPTPTTPAPTPAPPTPTPPTSTPTTPGGLPATGANLYWGVPVAAGLLLAIGAALTITNHRRRDS
ncbi:InlB B-repeat-containing protein [Microbacterium sp. A82]|uniref:InlB B-repeat-containing protein n=1 Tax=Microbacterium sp. A82 TaxID=3450452 RepID=UPI003F36E01A